jgi:acyl carrier protein
VTNDELMKILREEIGNIAPEMEGAAVDADANLREAFDLDSMDFLNLITAIHQRLGIDIPEADYAQFSSLKSAGTYLVKRAGIK